MPSSLPIAESSRAIRTSAFIASATSSGGIMPGDGLSRSQGYANSSGLKRTLSTEQTVLQGIDTSAPANKRPRIDVAAEHRNPRLASVNGLAPDRLIELYEKSQSILDGNKVTRQIDGEQYNGTMPSRDFYVHQWCWDSATHAMGLAEVAPERALDEISSLCLGQWDNGMVPQIQFFPENGNKIYFPGAEFWGTQNQSPKGVETSGITQPPVLSLATPKVAKAVLDTLPMDRSTWTAQQQKTFQRLENVLARTFQYNEFLKIVRDPEDSGLITVVHPWESGLDNAPQWDALLQHAAFEEANIPPHVKSLVDVNRKDVVTKTDQGDKDNAAERPEQKKFTII